jgi:hypothetical protein
LSLGYALEDVVLSLGYALEDVVLSLGYALDMQCPNAARNRFHHPQTRPDRVLNPPTLDSMATSNLSRE